MYDCQAQAAEQLCAGEWLWILKARQLGITWLMAAYVVWLVTFHERRTIAILNQDKEYAEDFISRIRLIYTLLPDDMHQPLGVDNKTRMEFLGTGGLVRAFAASTKSARSLTADLVVFDEAAFIEVVRAGILRAARAAAAPTLERGRGQMVALSTSAGPRGDFYETFQDASAGKSRFKAIFFPWSAHPDRDQAWYDKESAQHESDPLYMKREYPRSPEEAFESAEGRVYPLFVRSDRFIYQLGEILPEWQRFRAIDWGGTDPFVCLWGCIIPGDGPGLSVDPACKNTIRELLGYSYEEGKPQDRENHACDALRYLVTSAIPDGIKGHLHIYREIYEPNSAARGFGVDDMGRRILSETGSESITRTVADRSRPDVINMYQAMGISPIDGQVKLGGPVGNEVEQGIVQVNTLVVAQSKGKSSIPRRSPPGLPKGYEPGKRPKSVEERGPVWG